MPPPPMSPIRLSGTTGSPSVGTDRAEGARNRDVVDVVPRFLGERPVLPPAGHPAVDEPGVAGETGLGAEAEALGDPRPEALDHRVRGVDQP